MTASIRCDGQGPSLDDLLACYLSGQMSEKQWAKWCEDFKELPKMLSRVYDAKGEDND